MVNGAQASNGGEHGGKLQFWSQRMKLVPGLAGRGESWRKEIGGEICSLRVHFFASPELYRP